MNRFASCVSPTRSCATGRLGEYRRREIARLLAVVPAPGMPVFAFTAREHVAMGRTPYLGHLQPDLVGQLLLTDAQFLAAQPDPQTDVTIDRVGRALKVEFLGHDGH